MSSRNYPRLQIEEFGRKLIETGDLDPLYIALYKSELPDDQRARWLLGYWCLYNAGLASWLSEQEGDAFWDALFLAADNTTPSPIGGRWPRGAERRHWRGAQAKASALNLQNAWSRPERLVEWLAYGDANQPEPVPDTVQFKDVSERVQTLRGFGPWISFKVGDMLDRLDIVNVCFEQAEVFMFDDPRKAALMLTRQRLGLPENAKLKDETAAIAQVVAYLKEQFKELYAAPMLDRPIDLQEVETVLCKWKSHCNGHYPVGNDTIEINEGMEPWAAVSETARLVKSNMPKWRD